MWEKYNWWWNIGNSVKECYSTKGSTKNGTMVGEEAGKKEFLNFG